MDKRENQGFPDESLFRKAEPREERADEGPEVPRPPFPKVEALLLAGIAAACLLSLFVPDRGLDLAASLAPPSPAHPFGTDALGRDLLLMVLQGGARSLFIGILAALEAALIALAYAGLCAFAPGWLGEMMIRFLDILTSIPSILLLLFLTAIFGRMNTLAIALSIGACTWMGLARVMRTQIIRMKASESFQASRLMGAGASDLILRHALPLVASDCLFMIVMNVRSAVVDESTLSFMGLGLPVEVATWGSLLSMAQGALLTGAWWLILIPGAFLVLTLICLTDLSQWMKERFS